jgi:hypothetical protein
VARDERAARVERWALQGESRKLLPKDRVRICYRNHLPDKPVEVWYSEEKKRAHYRNLMMCGSVWTCPICSAKITERRRAELTDAIERGKSFDTILLTLTMHHTRRDELAVLLSALSGAYRKLTGGRWYKDLTDVAGVIGSVKGLEVTHWLNGWHPHLHVLVFFDHELTPQDVAEFERSVKVRWLDKLQAVGQSADLDHGVSVTHRRGDIAAYVAKFGRLPQPGRWTVEHELAKSPSKLGRGEHRTPFQILRDSLAGDDRSGRLFVEYSKAFKRKHQLQWSRGLRKLLGVSTEATDDQAAKAVDQNAVMSARFTFQQWRAILAHDARAEVLEVANSGHADDVREFVRSLCDRPLPAKIGRDLEIVPQVNKLARAYNRRASRNAFLGMGGRPLLGMFTGIASAPQVVPMRC